MKTTFLAEFARMGNISAACRSIGLERHNVYRWIDGDPNFAQAYRDAEIESTERLEEEAYRRAHSGVPRIKRAYHDGRIIDDYTELAYSDTLLIFLLKARRPDVYRDRVSMDVEQRVSLSQARELLEISG